MENTIDELKTKLKQIPGITKKQSEKILDYVLKADMKNIEKFFSDLILLKNSVYKCETCNQYLFEENCNNCSDRTKAKKILVVEKASDIAKFEGLNIFDGRYFVMETIYSLKNDNDLFNDNLEKLLNLIKPSTEEIILALNSSIEGQFTMKYISKYIRDNAKFNNVYQLSIGMPIGSSVEYADEITLKQSLLNKSKV